MLIVYCLVLALSMSVKVYIDWSLVVLRFTAAYDKVYCASKKAHFDCLPQAYKVVDGARIKWCNLLLLDAIIYYCNADNFNFISRRAFNQQYELFESVMGSMKTSTSLEGCGVSLTNLEVVFEPSVSFPWNVIESLKFCMVQSPPCKSKLKFLTSVDLLCSHPTLTSAAMPDVLLRVVKSVLRAVPQYHQQHLLCTVRPTYKLSEDRLASFKYLPPPPMPSSRPSRPRSGHQSHGDVSRGNKRAWSEDAYTDAFPPPNKRSHSASGAHSSSLFQLTPQFFDQIFHDLNSSCITTEASPSPTSSTGYISSSGSSNTSSSYSDHSSLPPFWQSVCSDVTTSSLSDESHPLLGNISFDSMDSIESLNEAINLLNGY